MKALHTLVLAAGLLGGGMGAEAALLDRGGGMIYDTELNITWLQNWNQVGAPSDGVPPPGDWPGRMGWDQAVAWASGLSFGGYDDWRLPTMIDTGAPGCDWDYRGGTDCGANVQTRAGGTVYSEMAHLWYETLGNLSICDPVLSTESSCSARTVWGLQNTGPFLNMMSDSYWQGLEYGPDTTNAWFFGTGVGDQVDADKPSDVYAVAVRNGDVPEPQSLALVLVALGAASAAGRAMGRGKRSNGALAPR